MNPGHSDSVCSYIFNLLKSNTSHPSRRCYRFGNKFYVELCKRKLRKSTPTEAYIQRERYVYFPAV